MAQLIFLLNSEIICSVFGVPISARLSKYSWNWNRQNKSCLFFPSLFIIFSTRCGIQLLTIASLLVWLCIIFAHTQNFKKLQHSSIPLKLKWNLSADSKGKTHSQLNKVFLCYLILRNLNSVCAVQGNPSTTERSKKLVRA